MRDTTNWKILENIIKIDIINDILSNNKENITINDDVWIITPFRKQAEKLDEKFNKQIEADTVHKFQWRKNIIIFSTVLDNTKAWNITIINVSVSRAKNKFIVVTDNELFF